MRALSNFTEGPAEIKENLQGWPSQKTLSNSVLSEGIPENDFLFVLLNCDGLRTIQARYEWWDKNSKLRVSHQPPSILYLHMRKKNEILFFICWGGNCMTGEFSKYISSDSYSNKADLDMVP